MFSDEWESLGVPWRTAFSLAWESHQRGSPGVGAVVHDDDGRIVASGRSRRGESSTGVNQLSGSRMAHAELNALAGLRVDEHDGLTLLVTLEPCLLCAAAIAISRVPRVVFAGRDPVWTYLQVLPRYDARLASRWPVVEGPLTGKFAAWASLVPLLKRLELDPSGQGLEEEFERELRGVVALAVEFASDGTARYLRPLTVEDALDHVWQRLPE